MPFVHQIFIERDGSGSFRFVPEDPTATVSPTDQIFWTNNDHQPHWLIRKPSGAQPSDDDKTFFMDKAFNAGQPSVTFVVPDAADGTQRVHPATAPFDLQYINAVTDASGKLTTNGPTGTIHVEPLQASDS